MRINTFKFFNEYGWSYETKKRIGNSMRFSWLSKLLYKIFKRKVTITI